MGVYVYDGSFAGLVCAVKAGAGDPSAEISLKAPEQDSLFCRAETVEPSTAACSEFLRRLDALSGAATSETIKLFWLWNGQDKDKTLLAYARMAFSKGRSLNALQEDPVVARMRRGASAVLREARQLKRILRFAELSDGTLYARVEPDHDILPLIAGHFRRKMAASGWVIQDAGRRRAALYFSGRLRLTDLKECSQAPFTGKEAGLPGFWRALFNSLATSEKANPRRQRENVPLKYRGNMPEF